jgi:hypothetical protein
VKRWDCSERPMAFVVAETMVAWNNHATPTVCLQVELEIYLLGRMTNCASFAKIADPARQFALNLRMLICEHFKIKF